MAEATDEVRHDVMIKSRKKLEMSGVSDVVSYDDKEILAQTKGFGVTIEGDSLKIERFNCDTGELIVSGTINGLFYFEKDFSKKKKGIGGLFK